MVAILACLGVQLQLLDYILATTVMLMSITGYEKTKETKIVNLKKKNRNLEKVLQQGEDSGTL